MLTTQRRDRRAQLRLESLDDPLVLSAGARGATAQAAVHHDVANQTRHMTNHAHHARQAAHRANLGAHGQRSIGHGTSVTLPANTSAALQSLYQEYEKQAGGISFTPGQPTDKQLQISGTSVAVQLKMAPSGDFNTLPSDLKADGLQVNGSSATYGLVEGMLPIAELPAAARVAASVTPAPAPAMS
jgi:hypothetical protein